MNITEFENNKLKNLLKAKDFLSKSHPNIMLEIVVKRPKSFENQNDSSLYSTQMFVINLMSLTIINYVSFEGDDILNVGVSSLCGEFSLSGEKHTFKNFYRIIKPLLLNRSVNVLKKENIYSE